MVENLPVSEKFKKHDIAEPSSVTANFVEYLQREFPPSLIAEKIKQLLNATHVTKGGREIVDNRAVEAGLKLALAYTVGLPVVRQEIKTHSIFETSEDVMKRAESSPAFAREVAALHERLNKKKQTVDVSP